MPNPSFEYSYCGCDLSTIYSGFANRVKTSRRAIIVVCTAHVVAETKIAGLIVINGKQFVGGVSVSRVMVGSCPEDKALRCTLKFSYE